MKIYNFLLNTVILPISEFVFNIPLSKEIKNLDQITQLSSDEIEKIQSKKLAKLLSFCVENSDYYKQLNIEFNFENSLENSLENLKKFPILTKLILKENTNLILTQPKKQLLKNGSSGSTGEQTFVYWSKKEQTINRATQLLWWKWSGYQIGDRLIQTGITPNRTGLKKYKDYFFRTNYVQAFSHNKLEISNFLKSLDPNKEYILAGYASSLYVISKIALENNIKLKINSAISWGDKLFDHYRISIKKAFGSNTFETYGSAEGLMIGAQKDLNYLYLMSPNVVVEILDDNGNEVNDGELGNVVITNLNGYAMPLIRYKVGDLAIKLPKEKYPKNRALNLPIFEKIIGRDTDIIKTPQGNYMVVHSFTGIFEHISEIKQFCVVQNNIHGIEINYIKAEGFSDAVLDKITFEIRKYITEPFQIKYNEVLEIKATASGKPQLIVSNLIK